VLKVYVFSIKTIKASTDESSKNKNSLGELCKQKYFRKVEQQQQTIETLLLVGFFIRSTVIG